MIFISSSLFLAFLKNSFHFMLTCIHCSNPSMTVSMWSSPLCFWLLFLVLSSFYASFTIPTKRHFSWNFSWVNKTCETFSPFAKFAVSMILPVGRCPGASLEKSFALNFLHAQHEF